jgi:tRNA-specific adenosine deaminase 1
MPTRPAADDIADCVLAAFDRLPNKFKPRILADGKRREWVPLAGMVLSRGEIPVST